MFCQPFAGTVSDVIDCMNGLVICLISWSIIAEVINSYLVLKYDPEMDLFDERFVNYGCNKVQYVDLLRLKGFDFYLLTQSFAMDIVHHE